MSSSQTDETQLSPAGRMAPRQLTLDETLAQALGKALACHHAGQLNEAEQLYRAIVRAMPNHAEANHQLGLLEKERQQPAAALPHFLAALEASPESHRYWLSYIEAMLLAGQNDAARGVLALGRQHGLAGEAVDALARRLEDSGQDKPIPKEPEHAQKPAARKPPARSASKRSAAPSDQEMDTLVELFNAGRHGEGENLATALTERFPEHGFGWKVLGALRKSQGRNAEALTAMQNAVRLLPRDAQVHSNLGLVLADLGQAIEAEACQRRALKINRQFAEAHYNLGKLLGAQERHQEALSSYRRAVALKPDFAIAHSNLGNTLVALERLTEAEAAYRRALKSQPNLAEAHNNLGRSLKMQSRLDEAEASYRRALELKPDYAEAHSNLGEVLSGQGKLSEAETAVRRALELKPDLAEAYYNLGNVLCDLKRLAEAEAAWRSALAHKADFAEVLVVMGSSFKGQGRLEDAENCLLRALELKPDFAVARYNLGNVFHDQSRFGDAEASFRGALELSPNMANAFLNLGVVLNALGRYIEADEAYERALELQPHYPLAYSNTLYSHSHNEAVDAQKLFARHCGFGERFEAPLRPDWQPHSNGKDPERRLQVGIVSGDFHNHAVANFIEPVLIHLADSERLSLHAYDNSPVDDHVTQRLRCHFAHWHPVTGVSDADLADHVRADAIDILIDLTGHTAHSRLLSFARKPAPLQASWIGYPGTTGLQAMDYFVADPFFLPGSEFDELFTEKIVRLPATAPFLPFAGAPEVAALPALSTGHITFGSFNRPTKISPPVIALWSQLLTALPNSRMLLAAMQPDGRVARLIEDFARNGIDRDRLSFQPRSDMPTYLAQHHEVDICLDTFPYTGATTTYHALWMGVPTLTLAGRTVAGRPGAAILGQVGLESFISRDTADFVARGVALAADISALARLRSELRERLGRSAMGQPKLIAASLERALRIMWQRWCKGLPAEAFEVCAQDLQDPC
ncbi:tetratricopeptide repeat protein [Candidatus Accumulibacter sp. ACC003]|uniref:tetratricopeptide repeat protein n=1 Tax=Candidatus Accumulibacter sp. ACC003 TaxID=2823334 RepID=UPI0025C6AD32|nr:tetratricopeptide repeat protein [Candidatus Accumulibacter sp. ACC003]